jgi:hypothetical protein
MVSVNFISLQTLDPVPAALNRNRLAELVRTAVVQIPPPAQPAPPPANPPTPGVPVAPPQLTPDQIQAVIGAATTPPDLLNPPTAQDQPTEPTPVTTTNAAEGTTPTVPEVAEAPQPAVAAAASTAPQILPPALGDGIRPTQLRVTVVKAASLASAPQPASGIQPQPTVAPTEAVAPQPQPTQDAVAQSIQLSIYQSRLAAFQVASLGLQGLGIPVPQSGARIEELTGSRLEVRAVQGISTYG